MPKTRITLRAFFGEGFEYRLELEGHALRVRTDKRVRIEEGAVVGVTARHGVLVEAGGAQESPVAKAGARG